MGLPVARAQAVAEKHEVGFRLGGPIFIVIVGAAGVIVAAIVFLLIGVLGSQSVLTWQTFGWSFFTTVNWYTPGEGVMASPEYGAASFIYGTLVTATIGMLIGVPLSLGIAIFLSELAPSSIATSLGFVVELLAAVPSVVYGLWALFVLAPIMKQYIDPFLQSIFGWSPLFQGPIDGFGYLTAGVILSVMVIPTIAAISRDSMRAVPQTQREAALSLGATPWETTRMSVLSYARSGIFGACILGLGRAIGETLAVTMVIGNRTAIEVSLFASGNSIASFIANTWTTATPGLEQDSLLALGLILLIITLGINVVARLTLHRLGSFSGAD